MNNKLNTNIFFNKGNFNLKFNPLYRLKGNYQPPALPGNGFLGNLGPFTPLLL